MGVERLFLVPFLPLRFFFSHLCFTLYLCQIHLEFILKFFLNFCSPETIHSLPRLQHFIPSYGRILYTCMYRPCPWPQQYWQNPLLHRKCFCFWLPLSFVALSNPFFYSVLSWIGMWVLWLAYWSVSFPTFQNICLYYRMLWALSKKIMSKRLSSLSAIAVIALLVIPWWLHLGLYCFTLHQSHHHHQRKNSSNNGINRFKIPQREKERLLEW